MSLLSAGLLISPPAQARVARRVRATFWTQCENPGNGATASCRVALEGERPLGLAGSVPRATVPIVYPFRYILLHSDQTNCGTMPFTISTINADGPGEEDPYMFGTYVDSVRAGETVKLNLGRVHTLREFAPRGERRLRWVVAGDYLPPPNERKLIGGQWLGRLPAGWGPSPDQSEPLARAETPCTDAGGQAGKITGYVEEIPFIGSGHGHSPAARAHRRRR